MKNVLSMRLLQFLAALCLLSVIPAKAAQSGDFTYTATATEVTITGYTGAGGAVTIPSSIASLPVKSIGGSAFSPSYQGYQSITSMTIPASVTSIGDAAFTRCSGLTSVTIGSGVTSIGNDAFGVCSGLTSVTIPDSVTDIGKQAFDGCSGLTSVTIGSGVTSIASYAFSRCTGLRSISFKGNAPYLGALALETLTNTLVYYFVATIGWPSTQSTFGGLTTVALGPPVIIEQPFSAVANLEEPVEFSVLASSSIPLPLSYQWKRNGITIQGATTATLSLNSVQGTNAGSYFVVVTNQYGSVRSSNASLTLSQGNLYTQAQFDSAFKTGYDLGVSSGGGDADVLANPNNYGLYSLSQVQALHVGSPLLAKDSATGKFKLTIGVEKSTNLVDFSPMAIPLGAATINPQGKMEFEFTAPDNAAFYRLETR